MAFTSKKPKKSKNAASDRAAAKQAKQKKIAIVLGVVFVAVLAFEVPNTMKMMNQKPATPEITSSAPAAPVVDTSGGSSAAAAPAPSTFTPSSTLGSAGTSYTPSSASGLIAAVPVSADAGQLTTFTEFASKDPFSQTVQKNVVAGAPGSTSPSTPAKGLTTTTPTTTSPKAPPAPAPTSAVISVNGELMTVSVNTVFPTTGTVFNEAGSLFQLDSLTAKSAKVSIAGGSYASGSPTLTLTVGKPVTLQNTADGTRYTLVLEPQGTPIPVTTGGTTSASPSTPTATTPTTTTQAPPLQNSLGG
jgi:hypothetical protein